MAVGLSSLDKPCCQYYGPFPDPICQPLLSIPGGSIDEARACALLKAVAMSP